MSKQILIETRQFKPNPVTITEVSGDLGGNIMVEGVLATVEVKNGNGRYYKKDLWEREIDNFQKKINQKSTETCGELDHPDSQIINPNNYRVDLNHLTYITETIFSWQEKRPEVKLNPIFNKEKIMKKWIEIL